MAEHLERQLTKSMQRMISIVANLRNPETGTPLDRFTAEVDCATRCGDEETWQITVERTKRRSIQDN